MDEHTKIVNFAEYCQKCQFWEKKEEEEPCNDCLEIPAREESHKPEKYKEKK